jgi:hypothetical protein
MLAGGNTTVNAFLYVVPVALGAVGLVLVLGVFNLFLGGAPDLSQKLMRWRIGLQLAAICLMMAALYLSS